MSDIPKGRKVQPISIPMSEVTVNPISPPDADFQKWLRDQQEAIAKAFEVPKEIMNGHNTQRNRD